MTRSRREWENHQSEKEGQKETQGNEYSTSVLHPESRYCAKRCRSLGNKRPPPVAEGSHENISVNLHQHDDHPY
jgi:hypothetical protein